MSREKGYLGNHEVGGSFKKIETHPDVKNNKQSWRDSCRAEIRMAVRVCVCACV